ncbi:MAG: lipoyl synthase [Candidatus Omnitrophica bacterium]|nr:lipoyl synthase [Candidatus Omnitrophota bacterium]
MRKQSRFPQWLRKSVPAETTSMTRYVISDLGLNTVCASAKCPNQGECYSKNRATFLLLGDVCTRACTFCEVTSGRPGTVDEGEGVRIVEAIKRLKLNHVVLTSVTRDDLSDGGARHFYDVITLIKNSLRDITIEVLTPDFRGKLEAVYTVAEAAPDIFNHNIETVERLFKTIRPQGNYERSLTVLKSVKKNFRGMLVKSGFMVGLGETQDEIHQVVVDLAECGCDIMTIGQYLRPSMECVEVDRFVTPAEFDVYRKMGYALGIKHVFAGPFVRSSYMAEEVFAMMHSVLHD